MHQDLATLAPDPEMRDQSLFFFPPHEIPTEPKGRVDPETSGMRLRTVAGLSGPVSPAVVATSVRALLQPTLSPGFLRQLLLSLRTDAPIGLENVAERLALAGYHPTPLVEAMGQMARRGGVIDVWPPAETWPLRVEFADDRVASLRRFNPATQRSVEPLSEALILPATDRTEHLGILPQGDAPAQVGLLSMIPETGCLWVSDVEAVRSHLMLWAGTDPTRRDWEAVLEGMGPRVLLTGCSGVDSPPFDFRSMPSVVAASPSAAFPDVSRVARRRLLQDLRERSSRGQRVVLYFDTPGSRDRFLEEEPLEGFEIRTGVLSEGFLSEDIGLAVAAEADFRGRRKLSGQRYDPLFGNRPPCREMGARLTDLEDLEPGDLVVHQAHGIGRYLGVFEIVVDGQRQEVVTIEYAEGARLHVPVTQVHLLSRYAGLGGRPVPLHRLGSHRWKEEKSRAEKAITDLASQLLETQAQRSLLPGFAFPPDLEWQHDFEAAFPYRETEDQERAIREVKRDMESPHPMDRLVCGDAGYGKTEVALRAAFKAVMAGKQVAVLVPTTVLAQQHYRTFVERMADYPIRVEMLSRFRSRSSRAAILQALTTGHVDIVIGTHALIQPSVRFRDLGLVIIDEEQRFGVRHKERLKELRRLVDVLTLTATPIPRTLYLSLSGARQISLIRTPPAERQAIETIVARDQDEGIREAIRRELRRDGQVFVLHNRIASLSRVRERIVRLVPEARVAVAHGRMRSRELATIMRRFADGEFDVLLCTTLIESGLDIPRANTILVDRADRFGLSDLYQIRGRVGRSSRQAYAIFLLPASGGIDARSRERLKALRAHAHPGAGFHLALRDLELRGAGNLLGEEQSGHVTAVGFTLYCQLLRRTIAKLKGEPLPPIIETELRLDFLDASPRAGAEDPAAVLPYRYVDDERLRLSFYQRLAGAATLEEVDEIRQEIQDRLGPLPPPVRRLLRMAEIRILAHERGWTRLEVREGRVWAWRGEEMDRIFGVGRPLQTSTADERLDELLAMVRLAPVLAQRFPSSSTAAIRQQADRGGYSTAPTR